MCFYTRGFGKVLCLGKENVPSVGTIDWWFCGECTRLILYWICVWECVIVLANVVHVEAMWSIWTQDAKHICSRIETYEKVLDIRSMPALTKLASCGPKRVGFE